MYIVLIIHHMSPMCIIVSNTLLIYRILLAHEQSEMDKKATTLMAAISNYDGNVVVTVILSICWLITFFY